MRKPRQSRVILRSVILMLWGLSIVLTSCVGPDQALKKESEFHYKLANNFFYNKNVPSALKELYDVLKLDPKHAKAHHLLGFIYFGRRDHVRALKHLQTAVTLDPEFHDAVANLGALYMAKERWNDAIPYFEQLLNLPLYRTPYLAQNNLGWCLFKLGRHKEAQRYMELSVFYKPKFCLGYNNIGRLHTVTGETKHAIEAFHKALKYCPKYVEPNYFLGRIYRALGVAKKARDFFTRCHGLGPDSPFGRKCGEAL